MATLPKLQAAGVGMDSMWGKMVLSVFVNEMDWNSQKKPSLKNKVTRLWLWKDVGLGVESQKILREGRNSLMQRIRATVGKCRLYL